MDKARSAVRYRLDLLGPFGLFGPDGARVEIPSKKGMALLALLATGRDGVRSRGWLQDMLWGSREPAQAQASLRRELSNLRGRLDGAKGELLTTGPGRIGLTLDRVDVDLLAAPPSSSTGSGIFLEGLDISGEEGFEDWLRTQRSAHGSGNRPSGVAEPPANLGAALAPAGVRSRPPSDNGFLDRPAVAVLRFENLTGDPGADYLAEGIAEDLIEQLSRLRWAPIIARGASFSYSTQTSTLGEIGSALGARYVVEGRLRGQDNSFGLAASISNAEDGRMLWARRTDFPAGCTTAELGDLVREIVGALSTRIDDAEMARALARPSGDRGVSDLIWRARWHHNQYTPENTRIAEALLNEALEIEPHSPEGIIQLAYFRQRQIWLNRGDTEQILGLRRLAQRAIHADHWDGRGYLFAGIAEVWLRHTRAAIDLLERAISLNPSLAYAYSQLGAAYYLNDEPEKALGMLGQAIRLDMGEQYIYYVLTEIGMARAMLEQWDAAIEAVEQSTVRRPAYWYAGVVKIYAHYRRGDMAAAAAALTALRAAKPSFRPEFIDWLPFVERKWPDRLKTSLSMAANYLSENPPQAQRSA
ncbi:hypothetical protein [Brevundimonas sp.]|uniref:hypothetical protein n=1 Tax=Brevundimonas sp. TaxID=1871086 RepID=UPI002D401961|nr:hypothetical protein [Brevundimonas sp.]HYC96423.1 hypothetical protein [Brevundimonas sp.]